MPRLTPPLRGQPFQAGRGVFACLGLAPEQLGCLGQHQRVRAAELPDLMLDWQLGGADLVLDVLAAGLGERPLQRALAAVGEEPAECDSRAVTMNAMTDRLISCSPWPSTACAMGAPASSTSHGRKPRDAPHAAARRAAASYSAPATRRAAAEHSVPCGITTALAVVAVAGIAAIISCQHACELVSRDRSRTCQQCLCMTAR